MVDPEAVRALLAGAADASAVPASASPQDAKPPGDGSERLLAAGKALSGPRDAVDEWAAAHPERFAGLWFDSGPTGPELVVGVVAGNGEGAGGRAGPGGGAGPDPVRQAADELAALVGDEVALRVVPRERPESELVELQGRIEREQMTGPDMEGTCVTAVGVDPEAGRVEVCISEHDEEFAEDLRQRYGPDVLRVEQGIRLAPLGQQPLA